MTLDDISAQLDVLERAAADMRRTLDAIQLNGLEPIPLPAALASMRVITLAIAQQSGLSENEIRGPSRVQKIVWPRQDAMRLMYDGGKSLNQIGRFFHRDHTTVLHGIKASRHRAGLQ